MLIVSSGGQNEIAPNRRQAKLLRQAYDELAVLQTEINILPPDITAIRLESAARFLADITGLCNVDETFNAIFEEFCIGK
jgi:tRNA U34 5-carboxymethylaminomethyl modifying GTPase MnmE/TrmE